MARYAPGATVGEALREVTRFDRGPFFALLTHGPALDDAWVDRTATLITKGIST